MLSEKYNAEHISTGDALREAVANKTEVGLEAKKYMDAGELVPDDVVIAIAKDKLAKVGDEGFILDGFPRTIPQAEALDVALEDIKKPLENVVSLEVDEEELVTRLSGRRVCIDCGEPYHVVSKPSKSETECAKCGGKIIQRDDDKPEAIRNRFKVYKDQTEPLLGYYEKQSKLVRVDALGGIEDILNRISKSLGL